MHRGNCAIRFSEIKFRTACKRNVPFDSILTTSNLGILEILLEIKSRTVNRYIEEQENILLFNLIVWSGYIHRSMILL